VGSRCIKNILAKNGIAIQNFDRVLDFGCGCGRVIRQWNEFRNTRFHGSDYNPDLIQWCQKNLTFARFQTNRLSPALKYEDGTFDFIYAISVFTHLTEDLQDSWMQELSRILKPRGFLLITVLGTQRLSELSLEEQHQFEAGKLVIRNPEVVGKNACGAYHPEPYVREKLAKGFTVVDFVPGGAEDAGQDQCLLKKSDQRPQP